MHQKMRISDEETFQEGKKNSQSKRKENEPQLT